MFILNYYVMIRFDVRHGQNSLREAYIVAL